MGGVWRLLKRASIGENRGGWATNQAGVPERQLPPAGARRRRAAQTIFSPSICETLAANAGGDARDRERLTPRERHVVKLAAEGNSNKQIAHALNLSIKTVETHRSAAMQKAGARCMADLTRYAARNDIVQL